MAGTFLCPNTCGFAKIAALEISRERSSLIRREKGESNTKYQARLKQEMYKEFNDTFTDTMDRFSVQFLQFHKKLPGLKDTINKWNFRKSDEKSCYMETFTRKNWKKLSDTRKKEHSFSNCKGCAVRYANIQVLFPIKSSFLKGKAKVNPVFAALGEANKTRAKELSTKPSPTNIKNAAKAIYDKVSPLFEKSFNVSFAEGLSKVPELLLQHKTLNERRNDRRNHYRNTKEGIENQMEETAFLRQVQLYY